jgi:hypothetical protein
MFLLMWVKILTYLAVFKDTRYLIKMIIEIIVEIKTFIFILFLAIIAYAQIMFVAMSMDTNEVSSSLRGSYVLAFGELGSFDTMGLV